MSERIALLFGCVFALVAAAGCPLAPLAGAGGGGPGTSGALDQRVEVRSLEVGGYGWTYAQYVPPAARNQPGAPVVMVLHGSGGEGRANLVLDGWLSMAEQEGFVVVAPNAAPLDPYRPADPLLNPRMWNAGQTGLPAVRGELDDVAFLGALIDELAGVASPRARECFVVGHSSGGSMAFRLVAECGSRIDGLAVVAAICWVDPPARLAAVPTLYVIGTADPLVPLGGGTQQWGWLRRSTPPVVDTLSKWALAQGCDANAVLTSDLEGVQRWLYGGCPGAVRLEALYVEGQGHGWPGGGTPEFPEWIIGASNDALNATEAVWEFFEE